MSNGTKGLAVGAVLLLLWLSFHAGGSSSGSRKHLTITISGEWCSFGAGEQMRCADDLAKLGLEPGSSVTLIAEAGSSGTVEDLISRLAAAGHTVTVAEDGGDA